MKVINTFILLCYNSYGDTMKNKKTRYIICIVVLIITLLFGGFLVVDNCKEKNTKKELVKLNESIEKKEDVLSKIDKLQKEVKKNPDNKELYEEIDKLNSENADLDVYIYELEQKKAINFKGLILGIVIIISGIGISSFIFLKTRNIND